MDDLIEVSEFAIFIIKHWQKCYLSNEVDNLKEDTIISLQGQKKLEDDYVQPDDLPKIDKFDEAVTMGEIERILLNKI